MKTEAPNTRMGEDEGMSENAVPVAVCQFAPTASREENRERIAELTAQAAARGAKLIVFPEYSSYFVDPMDESLADNAEPLDGEFVADADGSCGGVRRRHRGGARRERAIDGHRVRNAVVAVRGGRAASRIYRKQHLYDAFGQRESRLGRGRGAGSSPQTFELGGLRFGLMTCYDLRFPEVAKTPRRRRG